MCLIVSDNIISLEQGKFFFFVSFLKLLSIRQKELKSILYQHYKVVLSTYVVKEKL